MGTFSFIIFFIQLNTLALAWSRSCLCVWMLVFGIVLCGMFSFAFNIDKLLALAHFLNLLLYFVVERQYMGTSPKNSENRLKHAIWDREVG